MQVNTSSFAKLTAEVEQMMAEVEQMMADVAAQHQPLFSLASTP